MRIKDIELEKIHDYLWEIPKQGNMLVPGRIYSDEKMITSEENYEALKQVMNVAHLPGIVKYSLAMPDIHWGYGFPIGGVAATDFYEGVISPGGVGYDINCGVRLAVTNLTLPEIRNKMTDLVENLFKNVPTGVGASGAIEELTTKEVKNILVKGSHWAVEKGFGNEEDILFTEENGKLQDADPDCVSHRAIERGMDQAGTLGSGNHFLEIDVIDHIYNQDIAEAFGLRINGIVVQIHTGSRGLGYQVCEDYIKIIRNSEKKFGFNLPDKQLACAPLYSDEGKDYLAAMKCAANFAWNNRQVIMDIARNTFIKTIDISKDTLGFNLMYDVCHNIAKIEEHNIDGELKKVCVHRKGATRAFPANNKFIPGKYKNYGQPVLIPGDMGRYSFIAVGTNKAMEETFGSSCHGAGRLKSRHKALEDARRRNIIDELKQEGIYIQAKGKKTIAEEMPDAYKDVADVVNVMHESGISLKVARLKPIGVIKG